MRRLLGLILLACALLSGCASTEDSGSHQPVPWTLRYEPGPAVPLGTVVHKVFFVDGDAAVFPFTEGFLGSAASLGSVDLRTGKRTVLARSAFPGGWIADAVRVGSETVYVDQSSRDGSLQGRARWRIVALGAHRVLATSGSRATFANPELTAIGGSAVWTLGSELGAPRAFGWRPGSAIAPRDALPGDELECTPPTADLTRVVGCQERRGWILWVEKPRTSTLTPLFSAQVGRAGRHRIGNVSYGILDPVIFGDYVLWDSGDGLRVTSLRHPSASTEVLPARLHNAAAFYGSGNDDAAMVMVQENGTTTLRVIDAAHLHLTRSGRTD